MWSLNVLSVVNYSNQLTKQALPPYHGINRFQRMNAGPNQNELYDELGKDFILDSINPPELNQIESDVCLFYFSSQQDLEQSRLQGDLHAIEASGKPRYRIALLDFEPAKHYPESDAPMSAFQDIIVYEGDYAALRKQLFSFFYELEEAQPELNDRQADICEKLNFVGCSSVFNKLVGDIERYAHCDASLLIRGETGSGKEIVARVLHGFSGQDEEEFTVINCADVTDQELAKRLEQTLLQNKAIEGAETKEAKTQIAKATVFLDEVDSLSLDAQRILMQFLNRRDYAMESVIGESRAHARFVSATTKDLLTKAKSGKFREDLLYRLSTLSLDVPPLRQRQSDIEIIAKKLMVKFAEKYQLGEKTLEQDSIDWLSRQIWSGNIRELENVLLNAYLISDSSVIQFQSSANDEAALPQKISCNSFYDDDISDLSYQQAKEQVLKQFSSTYLASQLAKTEGNVSRAAKLAGKERRAFGKLLKKYNVDKSEYFADAC